jgi:hypothetical protein
MFGKSWSRVKTELVRPAAVAVEASASMAVPATGDLDAAGEFALGLSVVPEAIAVVGRLGFLKGGGGLKGDDV